ncbi:glycosyltransferase family 4 protein [Microbacterium sp. NPDC091382]|uniref:glycosyltransferase family 4 protein n=1 Tax=Microbacterium sp. NPDC091382 TaxID=3364210 RepID=UPI00380460E4
MATGGGAGVVVFYPAGRDLPAWRERHTAGAAPDRWPYGLDRLDRFLPVVTARNLPNVSSAGRAARRLKALLPPGRRPGRPVGVTWDENAGVFLSTTGALSARYSGVVWLTDSVARQGGSAFHGMRRAMRRMDGLWVLSDAQVAPLTDFLGSGAPPVHYVRFGVDHDFFRHVTYPARPLVVSVGGDRDRDPETLLRAMTAVRRARPDVDIVVQSKTSIDPPEGVTVIPYLTHAELRDLYARASVVAIATRPNLHVSGMTVGLEALSTGRPLVITRTPGMDDYFGGTTAARMIDVGDADGLARETLAMLDDPVSASVAGTAGRAHVEAGFTTAQLAGRIADVIRSR